MHLSPIDLDCACIVRQLGSHAPDVLLEREDLLLVASLVADEVLAGAAGNFGLSALVSRFWNKRPRVWHLASVCCGAARGCGWEGMGG